MKKTGEKIIELKPNDEGIYQAIGEVYREPRKQKVREPKQRASILYGGPINPIAATSQNEKIQSTLEGMRTGLAIFRALKNLLR